jgi:predicted ATPase/DNA-binding SARP family transcriptional activator
MDFRILGPLEVLDEGRAIALPGSKQRALLALLLLHTDQTLSTERLVDDLWGERPPASPAKTVQVHISRLRKALAAGNGAVDLLVTREHGYQLQLDPERLDGNRFERLAAEGRGELAAGRPGPAASLLEEALSLWRGPALADLAYEPFAQRHIARLDDLRVTTLEDLIEAKLALGRHTEVVGQVEALIAEHPYRERLRAQLMLALYRSERQADALQAYQDARRRFVDELGIEPGERLREVERAVLAHDPALAAPESTPGVHGAAGPAGRPSDARGELPTGVVTFLLTDVEASSALWEADADAMAAALELHDELIARTAQTHRGRLLKAKGEGDSTLTVFRRASDAVAAAVELREELGGTRWPDGLELRVRIALHTGEAHERDGDYFGLALNRAARLRALAGGGTTVMSQSTAEIVQDRLPPGVDLVDLGRQDLRGLSRPENVFELRAGPLSVDAAHAHSVRVGVRAGTAALRPGARRPHTLPDPLTSFVGRERELADLQEALAATRLLTLTGPGGCGKTRLALKAASELSNRFPGGVWWVELAALADEQLVGAAIAEALGVRPLPGMTELQAACAYLATRRSLVILDNCEHLLSACAGVAEALLQAAPEVAVLATGRAPLGVGGETDWRVPPLSLPRPGSAGSAEALAGSDAVSLFVERARKVRRGFAVTDANAESIASLCSELDGQPLAIELAAARVRMLSVEQIATGVSDRFRLLTGGPRTATPRQQTLRASVDWSHDLLSTHERLLLRRVAVFAGGFTLDAVDLVCAGDGVERDRTLDLLGSLVDQSLVIAEERQLGVRYRLLETVRQYGLERLAAAGESEGVSGRHRDAFLALAERAGPELETGRQREWLEVLDPDAANLAAAIDYALRSEPPLALRFCAALYRWWGARGRFAEAELAQSRSLDACGEREPGLRARMLHGRAYLAIWTGQYEAAEAHATAALALAEEVGDVATAARARAELGDAGLYESPSAARTELARGAELAGLAGDDWALVTAKQCTSLTYIFQSDHAQAARANEQVAALAERLGDPFQVARRWCYPGVMAVADGRFAEARDAIERMRAAVEGVGEPVMEALAEVFMGLVDVWEGEPDRPLERLQSRLEHALELGAGMPLPWIVTVMAFAELAAGRPEQARDRLEGLVPLVEGREHFSSSWALGLLAGAQRLLADGDAEATALRAQASGERIGNRLLATNARLTLARLAAARGDWMGARQHAQAHFDACVEGGHATYVPACLDALAEVAAGLHAYEDAVRLFIAAERARAEIGAVRIPPEEWHWAAIEGQLRDALGDDAYEAARAEGWRADGRLPAPGWGDHAGARGRRDS